MELTLSWGLHPGHGTSCHFLISYRFLSLRGRRKWCQHDPGSGLWRGSGGQSKSYHLPEHQSCHIHYHILCTLSPASGAFCPSALAPSNRLAYIHSEDSHISLTVNCSDVQSGISRLIVQFISACYSKGISGWEYPSTIHKTQPDIFLIEFPVSAGNTPHCRNKIAFWFWLTATYF